MQFTRADSLITIAEAAALARVRPVTITQWTRRGYWSDSATSRIHQLDGECTGRPRCRCGWQQLPVAKREGRRVLLDPVEVQKAEYATAVRARRLPGTYTRPRGSRALAVVSGSKDGRQRPGAGALQPGLNSEHAETRGRCVCGQTRFVTADTVPCLACSAEEWGCRPVRPRILLGGGVDVVGADPVIVAARVGDLVGGVRLGTAEVGLAASDALDVHDKAGHQVVLDLAAGAEVMDRGLAVVHLLPSLRVVAASAGARRSRAGHQRLRTARSAGCE
jgi:hypothetical protein